MKKFFLSGLIGIQMLLVIGLGLVAGMQYRSEDRLSRELAELKRAAEDQQKQVLSLERDLREAGQRIDNHSADLKTVSEGLSRIRSQDDGKLERVATQTLEKPVLQPLSWAYVDKFKLLRLMNDASDLKGKEGKEKQEVMTRNQATIERGIQKYGEGKFDLILDKTFGDHHIIYRSSRPALDVTDSVAELLREMGELGQAR